MIFGRILVMAVLTLAVPLQASRATFSICAVDPATGEVGSAGASCISGSIILSDVHPGVGVIHTQSYWNAQNQNYARSLMDQGYSPEEIIDLVVANDAQGNPTIRQYGVVDVVGGGRSAGYTGVNCFDYKGHILGTTYAIAGNILLGPQILEDMETAFLTTEGTLADRLMAALQGANVPSADTRCTNRPAISAFLRVAQPDDPDNDLYLDLNANNTSSNQNPIDILQDLYDEWVGQVSSPELELAPRFQLHASRPNPVALETVFAYDLAAPVQVRLTVFNVVGQRVAILVDAPQPAGFHEVGWSTRGLPAGVYLYRLEAGTFRDTRRVTVVR